MSLLVYSGFCSIIYSWSGSVVCTNNPYLFVGNLKSSFSGSDISISWLTWVSFSTSVLFKPLTIFDKLSFIIPNFEAWASSFDTLFSTSVLLKPLIVWAELSFTIPDFEAWASSFDTLFSTSDLVEFLRFILVLFDLLFSESTFVLNEVSSDLLDIVTSAPSFTPESFLKSPISPFMLPPASIVEDNCSPSIV